jgi:hypothetical protein
MDRVIHLPDTDKVRARRIESRRPMTRALFSFVYTFVFMFLAPGARVPGRIGWVSRPFKFLLRILRGPPTVPDGYIADCDEIDVLLD